MNLPNASESFRQANPHIFRNKNAVQGNVERLQTYSAKMLMNKTEAQFAQRLEGMKRDGQIDGWMYEGMTLRWAGLRYTPDFMSWKEVQREDDCPLVIKFYEIKGAFKKMPGMYERAVERFRHAVTYWHQFEFEMWQFGKHGWSRKL